MRHNFSGPPSRIEVPITPMLDMTFQLLSFFIIFYHPSALEGQIDMVLPTPQEAIKDETKPEKPPETPGEEPQEPPEVTVVVKTQHDPQSAGEISQVSVISNSGEKVVSTPNGELDRLVKHLAELRPTLGNKFDIKVQGDAKLRWAAIIRARDACHAAGFTNASFAPPPDLGVTQ